MKSKICLTYERPSVFCIRKVNWGMFWFIYMRILICTILRLPPVNIKVHEVIDAV